MLTQELLHCQYIWGGGVINWYSVLNTTAQRDLPSGSIAKQCVWVYWIMVFLYLLASQIYIISFRRHSVFINLSFFNQIRRIGKTENLNPNRSLDCYALMKPSFCFCFVTSQLKWNLFVKPEEQGYVYIVIALARKGRMKFNPIAPSKQQNICWIRFDLSREDCCSNCIAKAQQ